MQKLYYKDFKGEAYNYLLKNSPEIDHCAGLKNFGFYEFSLKELGLPSSNILLEKVLSIEKKIGIKYWTNKNTTAKNYFGFSLTSNPNYIGEISSPYHQTWGSTQLTQNFSRNREEFINIAKDTYYDTYGFRTVLPIINNHLGDFIKQFSFPLMRSRVAYYNNRYPIPVSKELDQSWHKDESPTQLLRINIPLQTHPEHLIDIDGVDDFGNNLTVLGKHLEIEKAYIWNTRIPHRIYVKRKVASMLPRIHLVLGLSPWFDYYSDDDSFSISATFGENLDTIVKNKMFLKYN
jgi:hypothetical protein